jgi:hypothetical protein
MPIFEQVKRDLLELAGTLAGCSVLHEFKIDNVGLDRNNRLKYFLGFAFRIDRGLNRQETGERYQ